MSVGWKTVVVVLFGWAIIAMAVNQVQANWIKNLQHRIAVLEQRCQ